MPFWPNCSLVSRALFHAEYSKLQDPSQVAGRDQKETTDSSYHRPSTKKNSVYSRIIPRARVVYESTEYNQSQNDSKSASGKKEYYVSLYLEILAKCYWVLFQC